MDIVQRIDLLVSRIAAEFNLVNTKLGGDLTNLSTVDKTSLISAINELKTYLDSLNTTQTELINDTLNSSLTKVWSITKLKEFTVGLFDSLWTGVPLEHDTLVKISSELTSLKSELSDYVPYNIDVSTSKTDIEKGTARTNIGAIGQSELDAVDSKVDALRTDIGNHDFDYVTYFDNELV